MLTFFTTALVKLSQSPTNYKFSFVIDILSGVLLIAGGLYYFEQSWILIPVCIISGYVTWTFYEYVFHRWFFHGNYTQTSLATGHTNHHQAPKSVNAMPWFSGPLIFAVLYYGLTLIFSQATAALFTGTFALSYVYYGLLHHSQHFNAFKIRWWQNLRTHHFVHHRFEHVNFGVSTTFWDQVFRTKFNPARDER